MFETVTSTAAMGADQIIGMIGPLFQAFRDKDYMLGFGLVLMVLVAVARAVKLRSLVPGKYHSYVALAAALAASLGLGLINGENWLSILTTGLTVGLTAIGGYESIGRLVGSALGRKKA